MRLNRPWGRSAGSTAPRTTTQRPPAAARGWRWFLRSRPRFAVIGLAQSLVLAFATDALFVPFLLVLGADVALVSFLGVLPVVGSAAQALIPRALRRNGGNIRGLTTALTVAGETRGIWMALVAAGWALGAVPTQAAIGLVAVIGVVGGSVGLLAETTLLGWLNVVLPDGERRLVLPRLMALATGASAILLVPAGLVLEGTDTTTAGFAFAALFGLAGLGSLVLVAAVSGLPRPKPVHIRPGEAREIRTPALRRFTTAAIWNSVGVGMTPYMSVFAVAVHGMSPGFAVVLSGLWSGVALVTSMASGSFLARGSASWVLRVAYGARAVGTLGLLAAFPLSPIAVPVLLVSVVLNAAGFTATAVAQNEQLFRLAGPGAIAYQGRFVALNAGAYTVSGVAGSILVAVSEVVGFAAWALTFGIAGGTRVAAAGLTPVPKGWRSTTLLALPGGSERGSPEPEQAAA